MPVTQRWVHGGLILAVVVLSTCLTVLILGASRGQQNDSGLPNSRAANFYLKDSVGEVISFDSRSKTNAIQLLVFSPRLSNELAERAEVVNRLVNTYGDDKEVRVTGISFVRDAALLGPGDTEVSALQRHCPNLHVVNDLEGGVARAYRIPGTPTLIVIDQHGVIRGRATVGQDGAGVLIGEIINSLRTDNVTLPSPIGSVSRR